MKVGVGMKKKGKQFPFFVRVSRESARVEGDRKQMAVGVCGVAGSNVGFAFCRGALLGFRDGCVDCLSDVLST